ncbi:hypothetical protein [Parabacteroides johnsonii]|uniref:hypothetical protein n=1 Tax=Parabacteroides johnsonii TaxID=387661 RepID=UPI003AB643E8
MEHKTLQFFQRPLQPGCLFSFLFFLMAFFLPQEAVAQESRKSAVQQIKEAEDGDVIDLEGKTYVLDYVELSGKKTVTLKNGTIIRRDDQKLREMLFGIGDGFKLILDEVNLKGGKLSKGAPIVYVKWGGTLEMNGGAITEARVDDAVVSCVEVSGGGTFIMNGTWIDGEKGLTEGEIKVEEGGTLVMNGGSAKWVMNDGTTKIGGDASIREYYGSMKPLEIFAPLTEGRIRYLSLGSGMVGDVVAVGVDGYTPTSSDATHFSDVRKEFAFGVKNGKIVFVKPGQEDPVIETEEDLTGAIDELPAGTEEEPSDVTVETEISVTNPVTVKDKYITLGGGGTLNSLDSDGILSVNNGGLILDKITLNGQWIDKRPLLEVLNGSILNINPNAVINSKSEHRATVHVDNTSTVVYEGIMNGHLHSIGSLSLLAGAVHGQVSSFTPFKLSGNAKIDVGIFLGRVDKYIGKICLTDPLRDKLDVLTGMGMEPEVGNPVLIAEGVDGYRLTKSDLSKLNCITDGCEFYLDNDCILMRKIDPSANEKIDPAQLRIRTGNGMVEADGIPVGHRYALYNLSGIILAKGVSDGGTIRIPVSHSGIYIFQAAGVGKKIRVSE